MRSGMNRRKRSSRHGWQTAPTSREGARAGEGLRQLAGGAGGKEAYQLRPAANAVEEQEAGVARALEEAGGDRANVCLTFVCPSL